MGICAHRVEFVCFSFRFDLQLKVFCEAGYYGSDCSIFCQETDDDTGHFKCDPVTGAKICMSGKFTLSSVLCLFWWCRGLSAVCDYGICWS